MQLNRFIIAVLLILVPIAGHAQSASWLWWGTNSNTSIPVSVANPLPVTPIGGGSGMLTTGSNATSAAFQNLAIAASTSPLSLGGATTFSAAVIGSGRIVSGTSDGPTASDCGGTIHFTSGSSVAVTMPNNITTLQCTITFVQEGAGQITFSAGSGATIHSAHSYTKTFGQWAVVDMILNTNAGGTSAVYTLAGDGA